VISARPFEDDADLRRMQQVVQASWQTEQQLVRWHVGDLAWSFYAPGWQEHEGRIQLWEHDDDPVGWAWLTLAGEAAFHVCPGHRRSLIPEVIDWCSRRRLVPARPSFGRACWTARRRLRRCWLRPALTPQTICRLGAMS
jgi:hypothetical protein